MNNLLQVPVRDDTGQRRSIMEIQDDLTWHEFTELAVDHLQLPDTIGVNEPIVYHPFMHETGEALNPSAKVTEKVETHGEPFSVLVSPEMNPAQNVKGS
jgi:hypothetical protein